MSSGKLVAIEGVDGSGKRTQASLLVDAMCDRGLKSQLISFPDYSGSFLGPTIGNMLSGALGDITTLHPIFTSALFALERAEKRKELEELLRSGVTVVCDRYVYSNVAHQACRLPPQDQDAFIEWIETVEFSLLGMPKPDVTVLLDLEDMDSQHLRESREAHGYSGTVLDAHEQDLVGISNARQIYLKLAPKLQWATILCSRSGSLRDITDISSELVRSINSKI